MTGNTVYILSAAAIGPSSDTAREQRRLLTEDPHTADLSALVKELTGEESRRIGHFAQLAVACSRLALNRFKKTITHMTPLYLATGLGEVQNTLSVFEQVMGTGDSLCSPYGFVNAVSSTTAFHIAKAASLNGKNVTISQEELSFEWAIKLAASDVESGEAEYALVGGADESSQPRQEHMRRIRLNDDQVMGQGSGFLLFGRNADNAAGEVIDVQWFDSSGEEKNAWVLKIARLVERYRKRTDRVILLPGFRLEQGDIAALYSRITFMPVNNYLNFCGCFHTASAFGIASVFDTPHERDTLYLHVNNNASGRTMAVLIRAFAG
ncbi:MAG: beta-ketoacyl synthase N-terminal-like domain-containing protein [Deltaproteobacteria bacterium]